MATQPSGGQQRSETDDLHAMNPTGRFSDRAGDYARARPSYPSAAIDAILEGRGDPASLVCADVGAGTGISARLVADRGVRVIAIEPNAAMREAAEAHPLVEWREGTAEATGLGDGSVDLVLCAQAFHWFRQEEALAEFARVLRAGGRVALMWNTREGVGGATGEYTRLIRETAPGHPAETRELPRGVLGASAQFRGAREREFPYSQRLGVEELVQRARSASYVPKEGPVWDRLEEGLRALHAREVGGDGRVALEYRTVVMMAESAG